MGCRDTLNKRTTVTTIIPAILPDPSHCAYSVSWRPVITLCWLVVTDLTPAVTAYVPKAEHFFLCMSVVDAASTPSTTRTITVLVTSTFSSRGSMAPFQGSKVAQPLVEVNQAIKSLV